MKLGTALEKKLQKPLPSAGQIRQAALRLCGMGRTVRFLRIQDRGSRRPGRADSGADPFLDRVRIHRFDQKVCGPLFQSVEDIFLLGIGRD